MPTHTYDMRKLFFGLFASAQTFPQHVQREAPVTKQHSRQDAFSSKIHSDHYCLKNWSQQGDLYRKASI